MNLALSVISLLVVSCFISWILDKLSQARTDRNLNQRDITIRLEISQLEDKLREEIHLCCGTPQRRKTDKHGPKQ